ncbi:MAG: FkbM family methyltransferase [Pseudomonadota bacterium]
MSDMNDLATQKREHVAPKLEFEHRVVANEYGFYCVPKNYLRREVPQLLANGEVYEAKTLAFMRRISGRGDIVSGGAFIGDFFPALSEALAPGAALHSFEPNPLSFMAAQATIELNGLTNVKMNAVAVGSEPATLPLRIAQGNQASAARARIVKQESADTGTINVPVVTLDELIPDDRHISVLHLDIEGFEIEALKGATGIVSRCKPIIILEGERHRRRVDYIEALTELLPDIGYRSAGLIERNAVYMPSR